MDNSDEILNKMIQETLGELPSNSGNSDGGAVDFEVLEKYFENRLGQEYAGISKNLNHIEGKVYRHFYRFQTSAGAIDFPRSFGPFERLANEQEVVISEKNDQHNLFKILSILWPRKSAFIFKLSKLNSITLTLNPVNSGSNVA